VTDALPWTGLRFDRQRRETGAPTTRARISLLRRVGVLAAAAWLAVGASAAYAYVYGYILDRGFPAASTPAGVARGRLEVVRFRSRAIGATSRYEVYLPPHYAAQARRGRRFPAMYLLHGSPGSMSAFTQIAAANTRMDTLIARRRIRPMILVMPAGEQGLHGDTEWANAGAGRWMDYVLDVVRNVDHRFATLAQRRDRGIAGVSEGAYGALNIALHHLGMFSVAESWSGYFAQTPSGPFAGASAAALRANSPAAYVPSQSARIRSLGLRAWLLQGRLDWRSPQALRAFAGELHAAGADVRYGFFPGGHDWGLWRAETPRMLIAASRWFGLPPAYHHGFSHIGSAPGRATRRRLFHRLCLSLKPGGPVPIPRSCRRYRTRHGLPNHAAHHHHPRRVAAARATPPARPRRGRSSCARAGSIACTSGSPSRPRIGAAPRRRRARGAAGRSRP
jgi:enterochelin esterase-like enzyme